MFQTQATSPRSTTYTTQPTTQQAWADRPVRSAYACFFPRIAANATISAKPARVTDDRPAVDSMTDDAISAAVSGSIVIVTSALRDAPWIRGITRLQG